MAKACPKNTLDGPCFRPLSDAPKNAYAFSSESTRDCRLTIGSKHMIRVKSEVRITGGLTIGAFPDAPREDDAPGFSGARPNKAARRAIKRARIANARR